LALGVKTLSDGNTVIGTGGPVGTTTSTGIGQAGLNVSDGLTVFGGSTSGSLALNFAISGSLSTSTSGPTVFANTATTGGTFFVNTNTNSANVLTLNAASQNGPGGDTGPVSMMFPAAWTVLVPYTNSFADILLHLDSTASTGDACFGFGSICNETALGALGNTFTLSFIQVLDQSGQIVPGAYVVGDSGINYDNVPQVAPVPEPASMMLLAVGLASVAVDRWRRRLNGA
jgi:hypothetical protein